MHETDFLQSGTCGKMHPERCLVTGSAVESLGERRSDAAEWKKIILTMILE